MIQVAIWGAGNIAKTHIDGFLMQPERCKVVAVINHHAEKAQRLIEEKGLDAVACETLAEALEKVHLDMVSICLPPAQHMEATVEAAEHGLHILVEKPMANSLEECDRMIAAAREHNVLLSSVCQLRFTNRAHKLRQLLKSGECGKLNYAIANSMWWRGQQYHDLSWRGTWAMEGGGVLMIQAIHDFDLLQYMIGMPKQLTAVMTNVDHSNSQCEDVVTAALEYDGMYAQFSAAQVAHGEKREMDFYTELGRLSIPWKPASSKAMPNGFPEPNSEGVEKLEALYASVPALECEEHAGQILNVLKAIAGEEELISDGCEGRKVIELITAVYESATLHRTVTLPLQKTDPFYTVAGKTALLPHFHEKKRSSDFMAEGKITLA